VPNRLSRSTSPYLLQHADNPVDWYEWGEDAFDHARDLDRPVFLSIGYAACHWCHVMAHESFEDDETATLINDNFVAIKVDREERPDVDAVYMQATQGLTGHGGWPMSVFLTPDRLPFYAGTYFPPSPRHGMPSFQQVLVAIAQAWTERRDEVLTSAGVIVGELDRRRLGRAPATLTEADCTAAVGRLRAEFDAAAGGFGAAPKFPPSMVLEALLRDGGDTAMTMVRRTCEAMARGGLYDQLGGGFARYSVDANWVVPHFEKMLYDNALLLGVYTHWWRRSQDPLAERVVSETVGWLVREMGTEQGAFAASLDADSLDEHGHLHEGAFYVWTPDQLTAALGPDDGSWAAEVFTVTAKGTFEAGASTLQRLADPADGRRFTAVRERLGQVRETRPRPARDDKVVAAWNGWLIDSLVQAAMIFDRPEWLTLAVEAAEAVWQVHWQHGRLRRVSRNGIPGSAPGILEDYAALGQACVRLAAALADPSWLDRARSLLAVVLDQFDDGGEGFFDTAAEAEALYTRPQDPTDNATPSGLSATVHALGLMAELTGESAYADRAERAARSAAALAREAPRFAGWLLADAISRISGRTPVQVAVVGPDDTREPPEGTGEGQAALVREAYRQAPAGSVIVAGKPDQPGFALLADRPLVDGRATAYVCRGFVCRLPVTSVEDLVQQLS
jgi:uncharacterized protein YyaL (SSP411 family)